MLNPFGLFAATGTAAPSTPSSSPPPTAAKAADAVLPASELSLSMSECSSCDRVAILGGSFDPITTGHLKVACEIVHTGMAAEVWIVPCGVRPDKPSLKTPYMHRLLMCHLAVNTSFSSTFPIRVCDVEMAEPAALATYHLMARFQSLYPNKSFRFVIGADLLSDIQSWEAPGVPNAGELLYKECDFIVVDRPGFVLPEGMPSNFQLLASVNGATVVTEETSSSEIRRRIGSMAADHTAGNYMMVDGLLNAAVLAHIIRYGLYVPNFSA